MNKRLTVPNLQMHPQHKKTYRAPAYDHDTGAFLEGNAFFGEVVNKLGAYEDIGTVEEFRELKEVNGNDQR